MKDRISNCAAAWILPLLLIAVGCQASHSQPPLVERLKPGSTYLLHLPGIAGDTAFDHWWMDALVQGKAADRAELYDWTGPAAGIAALQAYDRNRVEGLKVARILTSRLRSNPRGKIIFTAESGGTGVAVWALERLPRNVQVNDVLLVAPALSPDYDLTAALRHVKGKLYYFDSPGDWFTLGFGTSVFGTTDGKNTSAAGYVGFRRPPRADPAQYAKLVELRYNPDWMKWGDFGSHTGALSPAFARHFVAPLLVQDEHESQAREKPTADTASVHFNTGRWADADESGQ